MSGFPLLHCPGRVLARMPLHPTLGKMLLCSALFGVLAPVATVAAALACKSPFLQTLSELGLSLCWRQCTRYKPFILSPAQDVQMVS